MAKAQQSWGLGFAELGKNVLLYYPHSYASYRIVDFLQLDLEMSIFVYLLYQQFWNNYCLSDGIIHTNCSKDGEELDKEGNAEEDSNQGKEFS